MRMFCPLKIRERRQRIGMTQEQLAQHADISRTHMGAVEHGKAMPTAGIVAKLAYVLRVKESYFFVGAVSYRKH
jgi:transcriptional regulator with XRE-family HTH domain